MEKETPSYSSSCFPISNIQLMLSKITRKSNNGNGNNNNSDEDD